MAQFPLIDQASLVMIPGAYKEGKIYSQLPTDGSGDFTFTRGTDTATRVNENGLIEKERANLLLQSNQFDTTWVASNVSVTSGQSGYDGSSDAWLLDISGGTSSQRIEQSMTFGGIQTFSVYAKAGTLNWIRMRGSSNTYFDLENGVIGGDGHIDSKIESVGNGWYRCSVVTETATLVRIYLANSNYDITQSSGSIYIQDAQLEQGLVATDYIETTTAPVYAGLTDNMPRLDYSGGAECGAYLLEPSRTNTFNSSEYLTPVDSDLTQSVSDVDSPILGVPYLKLLKSNSGVVRIVKTSSAGVYTYSVFGKQGSTNGNIIQFADSYYGTSTLNVKFNLTTGGFVETPSGNGLIDADFEDFGDGSYRIWATYNQDTASTGTEVRSPAIFLDNYNLNVGEYIYLTGFQCEQGSYPTSYIPTYGSTQTRAADVSSVTKAVSSEGSLFINVGGTSQPKLSVLGEYFDASTTENKVAIAYSSTALVISHNGSIVVDKTGTYDVSSLTQIQLGHSNGADQADSPISEFVTFDSFLTNNELNALTQ